MSVFSEPAGNGTYLTLGGYVELHRYRYLYFSVLLLVYTFVVLSDSIVVGLIFTHKSLQEPMYVFIAALLLNSMVGCTAIHPKLLSDFLSQRQLVSYTACVCQGAVVYAIGGSGFTLLSAMAYDRYVSICQPLRYPSLMQCGRVRMLLALAWALPVCLVGGSVFLITRMKLCRFQLNVIFCDLSSVAKLSCGDTAVFRFYGLTVINVIVLPVVFIAFTYTKILIICLRSSSDVKRKAFHTCFPHLLVLTSHSVLTGFDALKNRVDADIPMAARFILTFQMIVFNPVFYPIIYGLKMQEISKWLKRLLCGHKAF